MVSKWFELKGKALVLRRRGFSIRDIETTTGVPRSTLSGWLKAVILSAKQKKVLRLRSEQALINARTAAVIWHNEQKALRMRKAEADASEVLSKIKIYDPSSIELAFSMLYYGEGFKTDETAMGNSDPLILKFFITVLVAQYKFDPAKIKCELHLRYDQKPSEIKKYWSDTLGLPESNFTTISIDYRTKGKPTYSNYKGVCVLRCGQVATQRKVMYLSSAFCQKVIDKYSGRLAQLVRAQH